MRSLLGAGGRFVGLARLAVRGSEDRQSERIEEHGGTAVLEAESGPAPAGCRGGEDRRVGVGVDDRFVAEAEAEVRDVDALQAVGDRVGVADPVVAGGEGGLGRAIALRLAREGADVVVNAAPLTAATTDLFDAGFFRAMKSSAYFINVGRGRSVVTADLIQALEQGDIAGAGLDVTEPEPLPADHPLWTAPNVIITPHVAAGSDRRIERLWIVMRENLRRYVAGEPMLSVVSVERGY